MRSSQECPTFVILLDHVLDCFTGMKLIINAKEYQRRFSLNIQWVLLSSTEDKEIMDQYNEEGVKKFIQKPFSISKLKGLLV